MSAPSTKLIPTANPNFQPPKVIAVPPPGSAPRLMAVNTMPAISNAIPMVTWIARRGKRATTPAPSQAPAAALPTAVTNSRGSTRMAVTKINASASAEGVCPTLSVPGISSSGTIRVNLYIAVVGANEPIPKVSKKSVTNPMTSSSSVGRRTVALRRAAMMAPMTKATPARPMAT